MPRSAPRHARFIRVVALIAFATLLGPRPASAGMPADGATAPAANGDDDRTRTPAFHLHPGDSRRVVDVMPLKASSARIRVAGVIAEIELRQVWENRGDAPLEATYVFPTSTRAALHDLVMKIGDRELRAEIDEREAARGTYRAATASGRSAALVEQHRANVFQVTVGNILPKDRIEVILTYTELLVPKGGVYELVYPQVVGPRYDGEGTQSWVDNPHLVSGSASFEWSIDAEIASPIGIASVMSPSHDVAPSFRGREQAFIHLRGGRNDKGADRDFVLRFKLRGDQIQTGLMLYRTPRGEENFFVLMVEPPEKVARSAVPPREVVFIVDVSGSMRGFPTDVANGLVAQLTEGLRPQDTFNLLAFSGGNALFSPESVPATAENRERARTWLTGSYMGGGTELLPALEAALALPTDTRQVSRSFLVITDGYVVAERDVMRLLRDRRGDANVIPFGVGSSVNRHLINGVARAAGAEPFVALDHEEATREAARFAAMVSRPALTGIEVAFEGFKTHDVVPRTLPDLLEDRPLIMMGKYDGPSSGRVIVRGVTGHGAFLRRIAVEDSAERKSHAALRSLWARERVREIDDTVDDVYQRRKATIEVGMKYRLVTEHTSFVAVDTRVRGVPEDQRTRVAQPQPSPAGTENPNDDVVRHQRKTVIDFSEVNIEGELTLPEGSYIKNRKKTQFKNVIPIRDSFADKLHQDAGLPAQGLGSGAGGYGVGKVVSRHGTFGASSGSAGLGSRSASPPGPSLRTAEAKVRGSLPRDDVQRVIRGRTAAFRACYERALRKEPSLEGRIAMTLTIGSTGRVTHVKLTKDALGSTQLGECLVSAVRHLRFAPPHGGGTVKVTYPLVFSPGAPVVR